MPSSSYYLLSYLRPSSRSSARCSRVHVPMIYSHYSTTVTRQRFISYETMILPRQRDYRELPRYLHNSPFRSHAKTCKGHFAAEAEPMSLQENSPASLNPLDLMPMMECSLIPLACSFWSFELSEIGHRSIWKGVVLLAEQGSPMQLSACLASSTCFNRPS